MAEAKQSQSFTEKMQAMKARAEQARGQVSEPAGPGANPSAYITSERPRIMRPTANTRYFHASHKTLVLLDHNDQKIKFENHFLVTDDKALADHIVKNYTNKKSGSVQIREVNNFFYEQSQMIQPMIEALPAVEDLVFPPDPQPLQPNLDKSANVTQPQE